MLTNKYDEEFVNIDFSARSSSEEEI